jgi:hypothetical protein
MPKEDIYEEVKDSHSSDIRLVPANDKFAKISDKVLNLKQKKEKKTVKKSPITPMNRCGTPPRGMRN